MKKVLETMRLSKMIRLIILDDHEEVRDQLAARLRRDPRIEVVGTAPFDDVAVDLVCSAQPQIVLIDPSRRDGLATSILRKIAAALPQSVIVVLTAVTDTAQNMALRDAGAQRILIKGLSSNELIAELLDAVQVLSS